MADQAGTGNAAQIEFWNSAATRAWADQYARMDRAVAALTKELLDLAAPQPGERVLDFGCGPGTTVLELAEPVGPGGHVLGADVSQPGARRGGDHRPRSSKWPGVSRCKPPPLSPRRQPGRAARSCRWASPRWLPPRAGAPACDAPLQRSRRRARSRPNRCPLTIRCCRHRCAARDQGRRDRGHPSGVGGPGCRGLRRRRHGNARLRLEGRHRDGSRVLPKPMGGYAVGVLVQTNYGGVLRVAGTGN